MDIGIGYFPGSEIIVEQVRGIVIEFVQAILHDRKIQSVTIVPELIVVLVVLIRIFIGLNRAVHVRCFILN